MGNEKTCWICRRTKQDLIDEKCGDDCEIKSLESYSPYAVEICDVCEGLLITISGDSTRAIIKDLFKSVSNYMERFGGL